jgi:signal transduction protein with GAF and PtsI domain
MDEATSQALSVLRAAALEPPRRSDRSDPETMLLQSIVDAAATLFQAEAASIAVFQADPDRLEYRVAAGPQGAGVVGLSVPPTKGVVGYVFSTGEAIALSDVTTDPRFDRVTAERTGYLPRSIAAVPLADDGATLGVLQVLDRQGSPTFGLTDMSRLGVFAGQATAALRAVRVPRDVERLLRSAMTVTVASERLPDTLGIDVAALDGDDESGFWMLVDRLVRLRGLRDAELALVRDLLGLLSRRHSSGAHFRPRGPGRRWGA